MSAGLSKRAVLRAGYGAVIAVLALSAMEAYRIQIGVSEQRLEIYRQYVSQESTLSKLRRNLWLAGNDVRDFFIAPSPEQAAVLRSQFAQLEASDDLLLSQLARGFDGGHPLAALVPRLRQGLGDFWFAVGPVPQTMLHAPGRQRFDFLQRVVVPKREELYTQLLDFTSASQRTLQAREKEFADTRRNAAGRLVLMLALGLLLALAVAMVSLRHAEHLEASAERHYAEVERTKRELQSLSARLLEVEEEGRRKLSRELHDEIGQTLALLQIEISHAQTTAPELPPNLRERLQRARSLAERTVQTVRGISVLLRPALLDDLGLVPALQFQLEDFLRRSGVACEFVEEGVADQLPDVVKTCVYRVVQEALHNCEKHAAAGRVRVVVRQFPEYLVAEIEDNGCGFHLNDRRMPSKSTGLGLLGMRERVSIAGGSLVIDSAPGRGTRIALRLPLPPTAAPAHAAPVHSEILPGGVPA